MNKEELELLGDLKKNKFIKIKIIILLSMQKLTTRAVRTIA